MTNDPTVFDYITLIMRGKDTVIDPHLNPNITPTGNPADGFGNGNLAVKRIPPDVGWFAVCFALPSSIKNISDYTEAPWDGHPNYINKLGTLLYPNNIPQWSEVGLDQSSVVMGDAYFMVAPNTLAIPSGTYIPQGSTSINVSSMSPLFQYLGYNNGLGLNPKVGDSIFLDCMSTPSAITGISTSGTGTNWQATITIKDPTPTDYTAGSQSCVYTWTPGQVPDFNNVIKNPPPKPPSEPVLPPGAPQPPVIAGNYVYNQYQSVVDYYNKYYPDFNLNYSANISIGDRMTLGQLNGLFDAIRNCNNGWNGASALPDKSFYQPGDRKEEIKFKVPIPLFSDQYNQYYYSSGNNTGTNKFTVPSGCNYLHIQWAIGAGGGGGKGNGYDEGPGENGSSGGGSGAYVSNIYINISAGDVITYTIGTGGTGQTDDSTGGGTGGSTQISIYRPSTNSTYNVYTLGGGAGGLHSGRYNEGDSNQWNTWGSGGKVIGGLDDTGIDGNHSPVRIWQNSNPGGRGADSQQGTGGIGKDASVTPIPPTGYGAGGSGGGHWDGPHKHDGVSQNGANGGEGGVKVDYLLLPPTDGSPTRNITDPVISL